MLKKENLNKIQKYFKIFRNMQLNQNVLDLYKKKSYKYNKKKLSV